MRPGANLDQVDSSLLPFSGFRRAHHMATILGTVPPITPEVMMVMI